MTQVLPDRSPAENYLVKIGGDIASWLGQSGPWRLGKVISTAFHLEGPDGMGLIFWAGSIRADDLHEIKFRVSGKYNLNIHIYAEEKPSSVNVAAKRGARVIARDVERRFLSKYVPLYQKKLKAHNEIMQMYDARNRVLTDLAQAFGWNVVDDQHGKIKHVEEAPYRSKVNAILGNSMRPHEEDGRWYVDLELKRIPVGVAYRIAEALKEPAPPPEQLALSGLVLDI